MKKLKLIKKKLKKNNLWKIYKKKFKNKDFRFIITKIALIFNKDIDVESFYKKEVELISKKKNKFMFCDVFLNFEKEVNYNCDWEIFSYFLWYIYQTSTYYSDFKKNRKNIFINNTVKKNSEKRDLFYKWINSLDKKDYNFNEKIINVIKIAL